MINCNHTKLFDAPAIIMSSLPLFSVHLLISHPYIYTMLKGSIVIVKKTMMSFQWNYQIWGTHNPKISMYECQCPCGQDLKLCKNLLFQCNLKLFLILKDKVTAQKKFWNIFGQKTWAVVFMNIGLRLPFGDLIYN